ncbi:helix-turn-helix domain-containing protein [Lactiplantibacillus plantarum]|uniref:helix-turn-helix domain-containing protein n=1 Tax=Lactiplantibacillus plantarum TaxID=1590 RepID=UPI003BA0699D
MLRTNNEIVDTLVKLKDEQNLTLSELARRVNMAKSALSRYFNKTREFPLNNVDAFAKALHTTPEYILGFEKDEVAPLTNSDKKLIRINKMLTPDRQQNVYNYADNQLREQNNTIVRMPRTQIKLLGAVSAGTSEELQDDTTEVDYTGTVPEYDYALQVNGDSMEPLFTDQQIIFVKYSEEAFNGQIVIAYVDGKAYVKKYHCNGSKCELVSLNSKYDPIDVTGNENFKIKGVVVL